MRANSTQAKKHFLITPQNQTTLQRKQIIKSDITELVARGFIDILQNIFRSLAIIFSQSPKVAFVRIARFL